MAKKDENESAATIDPAQAITPEMMAVFENMLTQRLAQQTASTPGHQTSVYGARDSKEIESVNLKRMFGKYVVGFKDLQTDPIKKEKGIKKYIRYGEDKEKKPYITLILSDDGVEFEEREVLHSDYYNEREYYQLPIKEVKVEEVIVQNGVLGRGGAMAREIDDKGKFVVRPGTKAEFKQEKRTFMVEIPGFRDLAAFSDDPMGPLA